MHVRTAARVQERKYGHVRTYGRGLERLLAHTYMAGSERRNSVVVKFMGSQPAGLERNAWSCSLGGLGRNRRWKRGLAYRTTEETELLRSERGPVDQEGCGVPQNGGNGLCVGVLRSKRGSCSSGGVWCTAKWDSMGYCSSPPSTSSSLHLRLFIHGLLFI